MCAGGWYDMNTVSLYGNPGELYSTYTPGAVTVTFTSPLL